MYPQRIKSDFKKKIIEIEDDLGIEEDDRIDFNLDYYYAYRKRNNFSYSSEKSKDILYLILVEENDNPKLFLIEDLNVADL